MNKMISYDILCIAMDLVACSPFVFVFVFLFVLVCIHVLCFCAATDFSVNKDLYIAQLRRLPSDARVPGSQSSQTAAWV